MDIDLNKVQILQLVRVGVPENSERIVEDLSSAYIPLEMGFSMDIDLNKVSGENNFN